ncbi:MULTISPECIES: demethoxyubiquinone hydroxylase family protein [Clostridium]|jgi:rubrerythrin|uniref:Demethoxyubiquinone hydroxylase family protein n=1 Tax=Clostridium lapidicellarium TaxID=3240931 RepID=A0ABV4DW36_9CLOT|nr:demethoxyubiquinone hydroxylase family protein [uncultured Clostridium sp.]NLU07965.1 ubiquinone biosynthesis protein COQ7 [Clostridiales bacterium]
MPNFANPFQGNVDRKMTKEELIQAVRLDIAGELEAIYLYESHVLATDDAAAKKVIADIRDEEKAHVGELMSLLKILDPDEAVHFASGETEVAEMMEELNIQIPEVKKTAVKDESTQKTVGSLIKD